MRTVFLSQFFMQHEHSTMVLFYDNAAQTHSSQGGKTGTFSKIFETPTPK